MAISHLQWQAPETSTLPLMDKGSTWTCKPLQIIKGKTWTGRLTAAPPCMYACDFSKELVLKLGLHCSNLETSYINVSSIQVKNWTILNCTPAIPQ